MAVDPSRPRACVGCLDTQQCWICSGEGCHRCGASGRCHLCTSDQVLHLVPAQATPRGQDQVATAS